MPKGADSRSPWYPAGDSVGDRAARSYDLDHAGTMLDRAREKVARLPDDVRRRIVAAVSRNA